MVSSPAEDEPVPPRANLGSTRKVMTWRGGHAHRASAARSRSGCAKVGSPGQPCTSRDGRRGGRALEAAEHAHAVGLPGEPDRREGRGSAGVEGTGASAARELGVGWKVSPSIELAAGRTETLADVAGPGVIQHIC
ncbi:hypothetical protein [Saccharopolyspora terrae]|uniref:hypothetical protein n=1 Tax=Saccharopolyspora terrae TaxID=2530384 RepID=UPI001F478958|nr:hypothetical protein [Saccharopolyspora terrae]